MIEKYCGIEFAVYKESESSYLFVIYAPRRIIKRSAYKTKEYAYQAACGYISKYLFRLL